MQIKVGISSCLLGEKVRFDGGHKQLCLCTENLSHFFEFVLVCPEVGIGMPVPRKPIRLVGDVDSPKAVTVDDYRLDYTAKLMAFGQQKAAEYSDLCGYIFMNNSPSCGLFRVKVYQQNGDPASETGRGLYAAALHKAYPLMPMEEAGRLNDPLLWESFITRVFAYYDWQKLIVSGVTYAKLINFHARYKYALMAHSLTQYSELGRIMADAGKHDIKILSERYVTVLMTALSRVATRKTHTNVLMHIQGYLKKKLSSTEKQELVDIIYRYRTAELPLSVPITLLKYHFNNHPDPYIAKQAYLQP